MPKQEETVVYRAEDRPTIAGTSQLEDIQLWLRANDIDPKSVPTTTDLIVVTDPNGQRTIHYDRFIRTATGHIQRNPDRHDEVWTEAATTPCVAEPPLSLRSE